MAGEAGMHCYTIAIVLALFVTGSMNTILTKVLLTQQSIDKTGQPETFQKPFFGVVNMFVSMTLVMFVYSFKQCAAKRSKGTTVGMFPDTSMAAPLMGGAEPAPAWRMWVYILPPAFFDLLSMSLMMIGMLFIPASVWQMLRGANIIFAAILTVVILRRKLYAFHWVGVALALVGILGVSIAALKSDSSDDTDSAGGSSHVLLGVGIVLLAQVVQAAQIILEEQLLTNLDTDPLLIVGVEGVWGVLLMFLFVYPLLWVLPGSDHGHAEDIVDTATMIDNSHTVQVIIVLYMISVAAYNVSGMLVTGSLSGVMRVMLEASRTLCIWLFTLTWHYCVDPASPFGEAWTKWSYLQAAGFAVVALGQATYGERITWPCLSYPAPLMAVADFVSPSAMRAGAFASPRYSAPDELYYSPSPITQRP